MAVDSGFWISVDNDRLGDFYDLQALRSHAFAFGDGPSIEVQLEGAKSWFTLQTHVLAHASGFMVIRFTSAPLEVDLDDADHAHLIEGIERAPWRGDQHSWRFAGREVRTSLRGMQNLVFFVLHEHMQGRTADIDALMPSAEETIGNERIRELCRVGEMSHPFPVSFGTHFSIQLTDSQGSDEVQVGVCTKVVGGALKEGAVTTSAIANARVWRNATGAWFLFENQSIDLVHHQGDAQATAAQSRRLVQLLEFSLLRRAALRSVQRDTQRILTEGADVSRRRIDEWRLLLATTTDDYVLHDQISHMLLPMQDHMEQSPAIRDPAVLEAQVRQNIDSFQSRIDLATESTSTIIGALFGVVAVIIGLGSLLKAIAARVRNISVSELPDVEPLWNGAIDVGVAIVGFVGTWLFLRYRGDRLKPLRPYQPRPDREG